MFLLSLAIQLLMGSAQADQAKTSCTIWYTKTTTLSANELTVINGAGYQVKPLNLKSEKGDNRKAMAQLLDDSNFVIRKTKKGAQLAFSITEGRYREGWKPLSMAFSLEASNIPRCETMAPHLASYRKIRQASISIMQIINGKKDENWGPLILRLEENYLNEQKVKFAGDAYQVYKDILDEAKRVNSGKPENFFQDWGQVKKLLYSTEQYNMDYCGNQALMTQALLDQRCTNCQGETALTASLFHDAQFKAPKGWVPAIQIFHKHVQAVLYNASEQKVFALQNGQMDNVTAYVAPLESILLFKIRPHEALMWPEDRASVMATQVRPLYRSSACKDYPKGAKYKDDDIELVLYNDLNTASCEDYANGSSPGHKDNANRATKDVTDNSSKKPSNGFADMFSSLGDFFGNLIKSNEKLPDDEAKLINKLADNLIPEERQLLREAVSSGHSSDRLTQKFSIVNLLKELGSGDRVGVLNGFYSESKFNVNGMITLPPNIVDPSLPFYAEELKKFPDADILIQKVSYYTVVYVRDTALATKLRKMPGMERHTFLIDYFKKAQRQSLTFLLKNDWEKNSLEQNMSFLISDLGKNFARFMSASYSLQTIESSLAALYTSSPFIRRGSASAPFELAFSERGQMQLLLKKMRIFKKQLEENVPLALKKLNSMSDVNLIIAAEVYKDFSRHHASFADAMIKNDFFSFSGYSVDNPVFYSQFVANVFLDKNFFFTVEADKTENSQPNPMPIKTLQVQEKIPDVQNLPPLKETYIISTQLCNASNIGTAILDPNSGFWVYCTPNNKGRAQEGITDGSLIGEITGPKGKDQKQTLGVLTYDGEGVGKNKIIPKVNNPNEGALVDPRQEVTLKPTVFKLLLELAGNPTLLEPEIKVLLHHTYRKKLEKIYTEKFERLVFAPMDYSPEVYAIPQSELKKIKRDVGCVGSPKGCWSKIFPKWKAWQEAQEKTSEVPYRFRRYDFLEMAYVELLQFPKHGTLFQVNSLDQEDMSQINFPIGMDSPPSRTSTIIPGSGFANRSLEPNPIGNYDIFYFNNTAQTRAVFDSPYDYFNYENRLDPSEAIMVILRSGFVTGEPTWVIYQVGRGKTPLRPEESLVIKYLDNREQYSQLGKFTDPNLFFEK